MSAPLLVVRDLAKRYGDTPVFSNVSFEVARGEFVAIMGESGVGKSTLLNCLAGLDHGDQGTVLLDRRDLGRLDDEQRALLRRSHVGFVFQAFHVLPHLDVAQNVGLPLMLLGQREAAGAGAARREASAASRAERVEAMLQAVGLPGLGARLPRELSGGQLQRVAIARALVHRPALLLADEPTGNLDPATAARVMDLLRAQSREHGTSLVLATHSAAAAARADRVLQLVAHGCVQSQ